MLRLVHSGIPNTPEWDGYYDGTDTGWQSFFRAMRHYLEHQAGKPRAVIKIVGKLPGSLEDSWARFTGPDGFGFEHRTGEAFSTRTGAGEEMRGHVVYANAPHMLELTIRELDDAFFSHAMAGAGPNQFVYLGAVAVRQGRVRSRGDQRQMAGVAVEGARTRGRRGRVRRILNKGCGRADLQVRRKGRPGGLH